MEVMLVRVLVVDGEVMLGRVIVTVRIVKLRTTKINDRLCSFTTD